MSRARASLPAAALLLLAAAACPLAAEEYAWHLPRGFPTPAVPPDNPMSKAKAALGERLFFEPRLSVTGRYSCSSCHDPARAFAQARPVAIGATGEALPHNAMALVNVAYNISFGWSRPRVRTLEAQMLEPMLNEHPVELGLKGREAAACALLAADPAYAADFAAAFPGDPAPVTLEHLVKAIASFERTLISGGSPFDRYVFNGEHDALSGQAKRGMALFFSTRAGCSGCHSGFNFSGNWRDAQGETGPASFARNGTSARPMRVPTLRNVALTAPYMHDGRLASLAAVLDHYSSVAAQAARTDRRLPRVAFSGAERSALIAFLESLTDESFVSRTR
ncbi:MAG: di-heme enzyme [Gammaproteobacteria bacterium]|nr:MAG: di-heme enzyme [Gammaproteobacteria bacterium]